MRHSRTPGTRKLGARKLGTCKLGARKLAILIASVFGAGFSPVAPGTVGSLAALAPGVLLGARAGWLPRAILPLCAAGLWAIPRASGGADHGWVVIDEVAGQWITLLGAPPLLGAEAPKPAARLSWLVAAFALFRLLDITKPGPIGALDRRHDAIGVMGDDIAAGLLGATLLRLARVLL